MKHIKDEQYIKEFIDIQIKAEQEWNDKSWELFAIKSNKEHREHEKKLKLMIKQGNPPPVDLSNPNSLLEADWINGKPNLMVGDIVRIKETGNVMVITKGESQKDDIPHYSADFIIGQKHKGEKNSWWTVEEFSEVVELGCLHKFKGYSTNIQKVE